MKYENVRYNHGTDEFGKDIVFSEPTPYRSPRHSAAQVKVGDVSGGANSQIDEILSQINDIFEMPYRGPGQGKEFHVSEALIVISGKYTKNAIAKINQKIPDNLRGSVRFLDRDDVETLVKRHWPL